MFMQQRSLRCCHLNDTSPFIPPQVTLGVTALTRGLDDTCISYQRHCLVSTFTGAVVAEGCTVSVILVLRAPGMSSCAFSSQPL